MARRNDNTKEELKAMAIASGLKILDERGLVGLSARKVTADMGYTIGTLYQVFNNYDDLILHMRGEVLEELQKLLAQSIQLKSTVHQNIHSLGMAYLSFARDSHSRWLLLFNQTDKFGSSLPEWYKIKLKTLFYVIEEALAPLPIEQYKNISEEAKILWAGVHGICVLAITNKLERVDSQPAEELIKRFLDNYLKALYSDTKQ